MAKATGLAAKHEQILGRLIAVPGVERFYLAGGSAIAWHLEHRRSRDLDLFSFDETVDLTKLRRRLVRPPIRAEIVSAGDATMRAKVSKVVVDVVRYPYPLLRPPASGPSGFPIASIEDLAAMKVAAIATRGIRRDFWDLFEICENTLSLRQAVRAHRRRFDTAQDELYHVLRALTYFDDAERLRKFPAGLTAAKWEAIKSFFRKEAPKLITGRK
jgi:hypothetical protein